jgi:hypothetical protein
VGLDGDVSDLVDHPLEVLAVVGVAAQVEGDGVAEGAEGAVAVVGGVDHPPGELDAGALLEGLGEGRDQPVEGVDGVGLGEHQVVVAVGQPDHLDPRVGLHAGAGDEALGVGRVAGILAGEAEHALAACGVAAEGGADGEADVALGGTDHRLSGHDLRVGDRELARVAVRRRRRGGAGVGGSTGGEQGEDEHGHASNPSL